VRTKILVSVIVALVLAVIAGSTVAILDVRHEQDTIRGQRSSLTASRAQVGTLNQALASDKDQITALQQQVDAAPSQDNCSLVRYSPGLADERILVICGPHAKDATDALIEYSVPAAQASTYLTTRYPLDKVFLDASIPRIGTGG
jgi:hypothetical protein